MFEKYNIGIMGSGNIAGVMAETIKKMKNVKLYAVASRTKVKAEVFAGKYGCKKAYGSYEELAADKKVDLIYIATPHSEHFENARLCILNGKPVLCEKAFTANAAQAEELIRLAREKDVFIAEAMWTRYMPMLTTILEVLGSGIIGELKTLTANLGYVIDNVPRLREPSLAGGALLDVGVYTLNFASMIFGNNIASIESACTYTETGVDEQNSITIRYLDGKMAVLNSSMVSLSDRKGVIYGTKGYAVIDNINNYESITVYDIHYKQLASYKRPKQISGYEYEVEACLKALDAGELECIQMPHSESIRMMKIMDEIRKQWGVVYPFEKTKEAQIAVSQEMSEASEASETAITEADGGNVPTAGKTEEDDKESGAGQEIENSTENEAEQDSESSTEKAAEQDLANSTENEIESSIGENTINL
ncbi:MAG: Gfo/Idh/MocA family oxidoreductase [Lachnospiraceae bacterium]|nr:Gfo/Idh/MocA family oxidoreductase [Lachnospiraceae bacterium]